MLPRRDCHVLGRLGPEPGAAATLAPSSKQISIRTSAVVPRRQERRLGVFHSVSLRAMINVKSSSQALRTYPVAIKLDRLLRKSVQGIFGMDTGIELLQQTFLALLTTLFAAELHLALESRTLIVPETFVPHCCLRHGASSVASRCDTSCTKPCAFCLQVRIRRRSISDLLRPPRTMELCRP